MNTYAVPIILFCFLAAFVSIIQMYDYLKGKEKKGFKTLLPPVFSEYLALTLEEKGRPGIWLIAFFLFTFVFIFLLCAQFLWSVKNG